MYWIIGLMLLAIVVLTIYLARRGATMSGRVHDRPWKRVGDESGSPKDRSPDFGGDFGGDGGSV